MSLLNKDISKVFTNPGQIKDGKKVRKTNREHMILNIIKF